MLRHALTQLRPTGVELFLTPVDIVWVETENNVFFRKIIVLFLKGPPPDFRFRL